MLARLSTKCYEYLFPSICIICESSAPDIVDLCLACHAYLPKLPIGCQQCGDRLIYYDQLLCSACYQNPPPFAQTFALFAYAPPVSHFIWRLKFSRALIFARLFADLLVRSLPLWYANQSYPDLIIAVPLHRQRLQERGFNQALEIAKRVAKKMHITLDQHHCERRKKTKAQASLVSKKARQKNVRRAFVAHKTYADLHIAIIDDVITTGNTVCAFAEVLLKAKARRVDVWCVARTLSSHKHKGKTKIS
jgi:ComF family protein